MVGMGCGVIIFGAVIAGVVGVVWVGGKGAEAIADYEPPRARDAQCRGL